MHQDLLIQLQLQLEEHLSDNQVLKELFNNNQELNTFNNQELNTLNQQELNTFNNQELNTLNNQELITFNNQELNINKELNSSVKSQPELLEKKLSSFNNQTKLNIFNNQIELNVSNNQI